MLLAASASLRNHGKDKEGNSKEEGSRATAEWEHGQKFLGNDTCQACLAHSSGCAAQTPGWQFSPCAMTK